MRRTRCWLAMGLLNAERSDRYLKADPSSRWALLRMARTLQCPGHFLDFVDFELVTDLEVVEVFHGHAALETGFHFAHVVLETFERIDLARVDNHVVAQYAHRRVATDEALEHHASSHGADLGDLEYLAHVDQSEYVLFFLRREHARERRLNFVDGVIDDVVVAHVHPGGLGRLARSRIGAGVEADDDGLRGERQIHVGLGDRAHRAVHDIDLDLVGRKAAEGVDKGLLRALYVGLDEKREHPRLAFAHVLEQVLQLGGLFLRELDVAEFALTEQGDLARLEYVAEHHDVLAYRRHVRQALNLDRNRWTGLVDSASALIEHGANPAEAAPGEYDVAAPEGPGLNQHRGHRSAALVEARLDHQTLGEGVHRSLQFQHFGLQQHLFQQRVDSSAGFRRHRNERRIPAVFLGHHCLRHQLLLDFFRVRLVLVDLVDRHDDGDFGRSGVMNRLDRLRHHTVVRSNHQHDDVGHFCTACAHRRKRLVARRIQECDHAARRLDVVGADVLGDAARFARGDLRAADVIEQRRFSVVHVPHDSDHGRARLQRRLVVLGYVCEPGFGIVELSRLGHVPHFCHDDHRGFLVQHLVDCHHVAELHQHLDDFGGLDRHLVGEITHGNGLRHHHLAYDRLGGRAELLHAFSCRRDCGLVPGALGRMPAGGPLYVSARLDRAALDPFVLPDLDFLCLLRTLLFGPRCNLRLVQRRVGGGSGSRRLRLRLARLALRELTL